MEVISFLGHLLLVRAILLLVILGGIICAFVRWKRHPRVSLITIIALTFYPVESFAFSFLFHYFPIFGDTLHLSPNNLSILDSVFQVLDDIAFAIVLILLVAAAFSRRTKISATSS